MKNNTGSIKQIIQSIFNIRSRPHVSDQNRIVRAYIFGFDEIVPAVNRVTHMPDLEKESRMVQVKEHKN